MPGVSHRLCDLVGLSAAVDDNLYGIVFEFSQQALPQRCLGSDDRDQLFTCADLQASSVRAEKQVLRLTAQGFDSDQITGLNAA